MAVAAQLISRLSGNLFLQDFARIHRKAVVVTFSFGIFGARAPVAEFQPVKSPGRFERFDGAKSVAIEMPGSMALARLCNSSTSG